MTRVQKISGLVLLLLMGAAFYALWISREPEQVSQTPTAGKANQASAILVDQSPLKTAQQLAALAATPAERDLAKEALRAADYEVDLAFDAALHEAQLNPPPLTPEAKEIQVRINKAENLLKTDQERAKQLSEDLVKAPESKQDEIQVELVQAQADMDLDHDELDDAKGDFAREGGNLADRILALKAQHEESTHGSESAVPTGPPPGQPPGLIHRVQQWFALRSQRRQLQEAKEKSDEAAASLTQQHNALDAKIEDEQKKSPLLAGHTQRRVAAANGNTTPAQQRTAEESATLLKRTEQIASDQKMLAMFDKRVETHQDLSAAYAQWIQSVTNRQWAVVHRGVIGMLIILGIALIGLCFSTWMGTLVNRLSMDRRQIQSLHTVTRVSLQVVGVLLILLVLFGPPGQVGTFIGLATAGLTVALKDFIVGFVGWFVLMGKNGIRLGDWVEINGVTGEVVQIGPFHTVLLETGNWTDSGHPTGRRVTFTNSFAIEGHYFNFSTTGQWLWDELTVVLPTGKDTFSIMDAIRKRVEEETMESGQLAEQEWLRAASSRGLSGFSAAPAVSIKPVLGGVEVAVRYITQAHERYALRAKLNQAAVELLGK